MAGQLRRTVSISEAAEFCQVTAETIRRWVDQGQIPSSRTLGGHRRLNLKDFQEFLKRKNLRKIKNLEQETSHTLILGKNESVTAKLSRNIQEINPLTTVKVVQTAFEAGQRIALDEPEFIFFLGDVAELDLSSAVRAIRDNVRTRMVRIVTVSPSGSLSNRDGADFNIEDPANREVLREIFTYTES